MSLINFASSRGPRLNTSDIIPRSLPTISGPSSPSPTRASHTSSSTISPGSHVEVLRPPPPSAAPMQWIWTCHLCKTTYWLGVTRRCLNDGHYLCQGSPKRNKRTGHVKHYRACLTEFDYTGWSLWAAWRRGQHRDAPFDRKQRDCWNLCDYPSHCRWGDTVAAESKNLQAQIGVTAMSKMGFKTKKVTGKAYCVAKESLAASRAKLPTLRGEFRGSQKSRKDTERDHSSLIPLKNLRDTSLYFESCKSSTDDSGSDDNQPPGAGAITATNSNNDNHVEPITPIIPWAPLNPVRNSNLIRPPPPVCVSPSLPDMIPGAGYQGPGVNFQATEDAVRGLPIPPLSFLSDARRNSQDSGYRSDGTVDEGKHDGEGFLETDFS
ncbi:MAG: hypothetical protein M1840_005671 [Geoglossum simile]|nr:MAG: hypothetical protein M1840_005671 [Geoglossum simile]